MTIHDDLKEYLRLIDAHGVEYVIVGSYAVGFHGYVRATKDIDILFRNTPANITKLIAALADFGLQGPLLSLSTFNEPGAIVRVGVSPQLIEMINAVSGLDFDEIWANRASGHYDDIPVNYISREHLIINKRAAGRPKDLLDIEELGG